MTDAPERIWLQDDGDYESARNSMAGTDTGVTWCDTQINDNDTEYLRADLVPAWSSDMDAAPKDGARQLAEMLREVDASPTKSMIWVVGGRLYRVEALPAPPKEGE